MLKKFLVNTDGAINETTDKLLQQLKECQNIGNNTGELSENNERHIPVQQVMNERLEICRMLYDDSDRLG